MHTSYRQQIAIPILYLTLIVMGICFLPHLFSSPLWLSFLAVFTIAYRFIAAFRNYPLLPRWGRFLLIVLTIGLLMWQPGLVFTPDLFITTLLAFFWLKFIELYQVRDLKVMILVNFYIIFAALIIHPVLWIWVYVVLATFANMTLLLKLDIPSLKVKNLAQSSLKILFWAVPFSILLFFIFPRFIQPLWQFNWTGAGEVSFAEELKPGELSALFPSDKTVMRITFRNPQNRENLYWHGLYLTEYDGYAWKAHSAKFAHRQTLPLLATANDADYEVLLEPHQRKWLFYLKSPKAGNPKLQFSPSLGLTPFGGKIITQRFSYSLQTQQSPPSHLSVLQRWINLKLPNDANPKLKAWAQKQMMNAQGNTEQFIQSLVHYIHTNLYWYRLNPKAIGVHNANLDQFWFQTREGYCEHYTSAVTFILRAAGIPARAVVGYLGGEWNPVGQYLHVRQKDAHSWVEYWDKQKGWVRLDPTAYIAKERIEKEILEENQREQALYSNWDYLQNKIPWLARLKLQLSSMQFFLERWLLFYNQDRQLSLLKFLHLSTWNWVQLFWLWLGLLFSLLMLGVFWTLIKRTREDALTREARYLQTILSQFGVASTPPATLRQQWLELARKKPALSRVIHEYLREYETLRLKTNNSNSHAIRKQTQKLLKSLRRKIRRSQWFNKP